jgi:hypothetical protein
MADQKNNLSFVPTPTQTLPKFKNKAKIARIKASLAVGAELARLYWEDLLSSNVRNKKVRSKDH